MVISEENSYVVISEENSYVVISEENSYVVISVENSCADKMCTRRYLKRSPAV